MAFAATATRKTVTVLFCDLADSTELGEELDPESLRTLLVRWYETMRVPVERHGGTVEKFIGDAVMAIFGVPQVHEDDALRAVRAALEMRRSLARLNEELAAESRPQLRVRIGINSGEVVTGDGRTTLATGDAVNTAKRLEQAAGIDEILIGDTTRRLVENAADLEPVSAVAAKGKRLPVESWRVLAAIEGAAPIARRLDAPLVGRARELAYLREELASAERERTCRLVTVYGPAGIGKSRLAAELLGSVRQEAGVLSARCLPYGDGLTFLPLAELVRSAGGEDAILRAVEGEPDGDLIVERICGAIGAGEAPQSTEETFWAVRRALETLARARPLVVCVEDVHWAEPTFLDLLEYVAGWSRDAPILLLCLARPELLDVRPRRGGGSITLEPLTDAESAELLSALSAEWPLPDEARPAIAEAAEGNPLFVEQMVAMLAETGSMRVPPTIQALLAARLDQLEPIERAVLERAAVAGREFSRGAITHLSPEDELPLVSATLLSLARKELVRPAQSAYPADDGFSFRHALIREAAYNGLPKEQRAALHERFGAWLTEHADEDELVGYHLEQAYRCRAELGSADEKLAARAGELLGSAGARAIARGDAAAALALLRRSVGLLPGTHALRAELLRELSAAYWLNGHAAAAADSLSESIEAAQASGDTRVEWYGRLEMAARTLAAHGDTSELVRTAERAVQVFEELGDDLGLALAWRRLGLVAHTERRYADAAAAFERALAHAEASGDQPEHARSADSLCTALLFGPTRVPKAVARAEALLASAGRNVVLRAHVSTSLAGLVAMRGDADDARRLYREAGEVYDSLGLRLPRVGWAEIVAYIELLAGDTRAARHALESGQAVLDEPGTGALDSLRAYHAALLAFVAATEDDRAAAERLLALCDEIGDGLTPDTRARLYATRALLAGSGEDGAQLARLAVGAAEQTDDLNLQGAMRLTLARVLSDPEEAAAARRLFELKGNVAAAAAIDLWSLQP